MNGQTEKEERDERNDDALEQVKAETTTKANRKAKTTSPDAKHGKKMKAVLSKLDKKIAPRKAHGRTTKKAKKQTGGTYTAGVAKDPKGNTGDNPCLCGCGRKVRRFFSQGHDARVKGWLKAKAEGDETVKIPAVLAKAIAGGLVLGTARGENVLAKKAA
jgi:hypothetical protein